MPDDARRQTWIPSDGAQTPSSRRQRMASPACRTGYPYISETGEVARDDTAVREIAAAEFGREFRELDEGTHSFTTEDLSVLLGDLAEGSRMLIVRGPVTRASAAARQQGGT